MDSSFLDFSETSFQNDLNGNRFDRLSNIHCSNSAGKKTCFYIFCVHKHSRLFGAFFQIQFLSNKLLVFLIKTASYL